MQHDHVIVVPHECVNWQINQLLGSERFHLLNEGMAIGIVAEDAVPVVATVVNVVEEVVLYVLFTVHLRGSVEGGEGNLLPGLMSVRH